jgi:hypothetical protein
VEKDTSKNNFEKDMIFSLEIFQILVPVNFQIEKIQII